MLFSDLAEYLEKLELTSKRLEITSILSELILNLDKDEIDIGVYMFAHAGRLAARRLEKT